MSENARALAIFIDFENLALGFQNRRDRFDMTRVLERLVEKGKIVAKKAYADWSRFSSYTFMLHNSAIELVEIPRRGQSGKNSADIRLCVDAMDLAYSKDHIDTFVVVSGDSDFSPLVSKLKELGKHVIGLGMAESTSDLLRDNCDEFIYYEDLGRNEEIGPEIDANLPEQKRKVFALLMDALVALRRDYQGHIGSSMIKDTIKRKKPSFNEAYHGYRSFSELLLDAQKAGLVELDVDKKSRTYVVSRFGAEMKLPHPTPETPVGEGGEGAEGATASGEELPLLGRRKSRRRRRGRGNGNGLGGEHDRPGHSTSSEPTRIRMSVPLPSGGKHPVEPSPGGREEEDEIDELEGDPRLDRIDEMEESEEFDFLDEPKPETPVPAAPVAPPYRIPPVVNRPQPAPRPQPQPRPPLGNPPPQRPAPAAPAQGQKRPLPPQPAPQARPAPVPARPVPAPVTAPRPAPGPVPVPRIINPSELPPPSDDEIFFSSGQTAVPSPAPAPVPAPAPAPPRPRSQPVPVQRLPVEQVPAPVTRGQEETADAERSEHEEAANHTEVPAGTDKSPAPRRTAKPRKPAATKAGGSRSRGRKKPAETAPGEPTE